MPSFNEQDKIINTFKQNINQIINENFNYQESLHIFNSLLNESKQLIDIKLSEKMTLYFLKKMNNFMTIIKFINEEISKLEYNLKQFDINNIIQINKLVDNLKEFSLAQRNIYEQIENKSVIKLLDILLVNYYNKNKEIFKSIKQIHKGNYNINNINNSKVEYNKLNIDKYNINKDNRINVKNGQENINKKLLNKKSIIDYTPKFKVITNKINKSKSLKKFKKKINNNSFLYENNINPLFNEKIGNFIKKKLQIKNSSSPCLINKNNLFNNNKKYLETETTMSDSKNNLELITLSNKMLDIFTNFQKNVIKENDYINNIKADFEKRKNELENYLNNIKNNEIMNSNSSLLKEINNLKDKNSELNKKNIELINKITFVNKNEINLLFENYNKFYEIFKLLNNDGIIRDFNKEEYIIDNNILKKNNLDKGKIYKYINNIYDKILEVIEIKKNAIKEEIKLNNNSYSIQSNSFNYNDIKYYINEITNKINIINEYLTINENIKKSDETTNIMNIIKENNNLLSLSDDLETPKSNISKNNMEENFVDKFKNILLLLDTTEKLIKKKL